MRFRITKNFALLGAICLFASQAFAFLLEDKYVDQKRGPKTAIEESRERGKTEPFAQSTGEVRGYDIVGQEPGRGSGALVAPNLILTCGHSAIKCMEAKAYCAFEANFQGKKEEVKVKKVFVKDGFIALNKEKLAAIDKAKALRFSPSASGLEKARAFKHLERINAKWIQQEVGLLLLCWRRMFP